MSVQYSLRRGVGVLQLAGGALNSLSKSLREGLLRGLDRAASENASAVVITGSQTSTFFSSGYDAMETVRGTYGDSPALSEVAMAVESQKIPVIAAFNASALGPALELGLSCHYRVASPSARFGFVDAALGMTTSKLEMG